MFICFVLKEIKLNKEQFLRVLDESQPDQDMTEHQKVLWLIHHDQWNEAHEIVQENNDEISCLLHGYLHDMEGDHWNASYWYRRAGHKEMPERMPDKWQYLIDAVLESGRQTS